MQTGGWAAAFEHVSVESVLWPAVVVEMTKPRFSCRTDGPLFFSAITSFRTRTERRFDAYTRVTDRRGYGRLLNGSKRSELAELRRSPSDNHNVRKPLDGLIQRISL